MASAKELPHARRVDRRQRLIYAGVEVDFERLGTLAREIIGGIGSTDSKVVKPLAGGRDLLPRWEDEWLVVERERYRQLRLHALEALARRLADDGDYPSAIECALASLEDDPLRESAHAALVEIHTGEGNLREAGRQYSTYRELMSSELGLPPSPRMRRLIQTALGGGA